MKMNRICNTKIFDFGWRINWNRQKNKESPSLNPLTQLGSKGLLLTIKSGLFIIFILGNFNLKFSGNPLFRADFIERILIKPSWVKCFFA